MGPGGGARDGRLEPIRGVTLKQEPDISYFLALLYCLKLVLEPIIVDMYVCM